MDSIYLAQKFSKPLSWDQWVAVREMVDYVCANWDQPDLSIWEVRNQQKNFLYSKIMLWVAVDRGLRLADKRSLPLKQRAKVLLPLDATTIDVEADSVSLLQWLETRDQIYGASLLPSACCSPQLILPTCLYRSHQRRSWKRVRLSLHQSAPDPRRWLKPALFRQLLQAGTRRRSSLVSRTRAWMSWTLPFSSVRVIRCIYFARVRNADSVCCLFSQCP